MEMRKLIESSFVSLDGVIGSPEQWALKYWGEENRNHAYSQLSEIDAFLFGRVTYDKFAASWGPIKGDKYIERINSLPKYVASTTLREMTWNATLLKGDVAEAVAKLKSQPGKNIMKYGTSRLDRTLLQHNLIDELHLSVFPVAVGGGQRLFEGVDTSRLKLELTGANTYSSGIVTLSYVPTYA
jgi:dihydrofolate reductase